MPDEEPDVDDDEEQEEVIPELTKDEIGEKLLTACKSGDMEVCREMVEKWIAGGYRGEMPTDLTEAKWSPLLWAGSKGYDNVVELLIENGFADNFKRKRDDKKVVVSTPLQWAAYKGHENITCALLRCGLSLQDTDDCGNNALHLASTGGNVKIMEVLLSHGCDINTRNRYGNTPLGMCTDGGARDLLLRASSQDKCHFDDRPFSGTKLRYLCSCCGLFFHEENTVWKEIRRSNDNELMRPTRLCFACEKEIQGKEAELQKAMKPDGGWDDVLDLELLHPLGEAVRQVEEIGGSCGDIELIHNANHLHAELAGTLKLKEQVKLVQEHRPLPDGRGTKELAAAVVFAIEKDVGKDLVADAKLLVKQSLLEVNLQRAMKPLVHVVCAEQSNEKDMGKLLDAYQAVEKAGADDTELAAKAKKLHTKLVLEVDMTAQLAELEEQKDKKDQEAAAKAAELEAIDLLKGKKKKTALKELKARDALITSAILEQDVKKLQAQLEKLETSVQEGGPDGAGANEELTARAAEVVLRLKKDLKEDTAVFEEKKAIEEKEAAKKAKKANKKKK